MDLGVGAIEEIGNHFGALPFGVVSLEVERGVFLVTLGGKAHVIKLPFIDSGLGYEISERNVVILHLCIRRIGPDELAIFTPALTGALWLHRPFGVSRDEMFIAKDGDTGDG